tara:strand:- start:1584 stop:2285 length:702 start_codon:yes stop_codon:yes gene_type:complete
MNLKNSRLLVVAAHPDDDILGCGGTLSLAKSLKSKIKILYLSEGVSARFGIGNEESKESLRARKIRKQECINSLKVLGVKNYVFEERYSTKFDTYPLYDLIQSIEREIKLFKPTIIFTHNPSEVNIDHRLTYEAVEVATRPKFKSTVKEIYSFEIVCSGGWKFYKNFSPTTFVDISKHFSSKLKSWKHYKNERQKFPFPRSREGLEALAKYRGMQSYFKYAEAFKLEREIVGS